MPSYTSVKSGYWSDPTTWTPNGVPKEGDTVTIAAGHTIILDIDLSGFPNGLAGLTINGTLLIPSLNDPNYGEVGEETSGTPWLSGWSYRRTVIVDNSFSSTTLTNFQIIIRLNTAYLIQQGKMREDCGDIRVTDASGNLLPIWIDPDTKNMWNTKVYVKVPSIPANGTVTLYLFYGNPDATDISDGGAVFDFFDDFSGTVLDENKWTAARWTGTGAWSVIVGSGYVTISSGSNTRAGIVSKVSFPLPFIVEGKFLYRSGDQLWNSITQTDGGSHADLVEHGYGNSGNAYFYRKATNGTYTNYQSFESFAPRGAVFCRFAIEWNSNSSIYSIWDIRVNSTLTQDRYTSGNCFIQLSTVNGSGSWDWIGVRKHASAPPAVYFRTLTSPALKVNANIAGTGTLQIGSDSYPIALPQKVIVALNGSVTLANLYAYGQSAERYFTYLAQDAPAYTNTITLLHDLNLRVGDLVAIGRTDITGSESTISEPGKYIFPVQSYDAATKTVTLRMAIPFAKTAFVTDLDGNSEPCALVVLVNRPIDLVKFGGNNVTLVTNANVVINNVCFRHVSGSMYSFFRPSAAATVDGCSFASIDGGGRRYAIGGNFSVPLLLMNCTFVHNTEPPDWSNFTFQGCAAIDASTGSSDDSNYGICAYVDSVFQNYSTIHATSGSTIRSFWATGRGLYLRIQGCKFLNGGWVATGVLLGGIMSDCVIIRSSALSDCTNFIINNVRVISPSQSDLEAIPFAFNRIKASVLRNVSVKGGAILHYSSACKGGGLVSDSRLFIVCSGNTFNNCAYRGTNDTYTISHWEGGANRFRNVTTQVNLSALVSFPRSTDKATFHPFLWVDFENVNNDGLRRRYFPHGSIKEVVGQPNTFQFSLTSLSFPLPLYYDFRVARSLQITITGTITQIGSNERVKVQIFDESKEPFLGDVPDFEQEFTTTGPISINWSVPYTGVWIVRILAYLNQTSNPITITNLEVTGGGTGGSGGQTYSIQITDEVNSSLSDSAGVVANLSLSDAINPTLTEQPAVAAQVSAADLITPTLQDQGALSASISLTDTMNPALSDAASTSVTVALAEAINSALSESVGINNAVSVADQVAPTLQENAYVTSSSVVNIALSDEISPTLSEGVSVSSALSVADNLSPTLSEVAGIDNTLSIADQLAPTLQEDISVTSGSVVNIALVDEVNPTLSEEISTESNLSIMDNLTPTLGENTSAVFNVATTDQVASTLSDTLNTAATLQVTEGITPTLTDVASASATLGVVDNLSPALQDAGSATAQISLSETINSTLSESVDVFSGQYIEIGVSDGIGTTLSDGATVASGITVSDAVSPTLSEVADTDAVIEVAGEMVSPILSEAVGASAQISTQDIISPTLGETVGTTLQAAISENISPTLQEGISAGFSVVISEAIQPTTQETVLPVSQVGVSEIIQPTLQESVAETAEVSVTETTEPTLSEEITATSSISISETTDVGITEEVSEGIEVNVTDETSATLQDEARVMGGMVKVYHPVDIEIEEFEIEIL